MRTIDIDETPQPWTASFGHALLRTVLGLILVAHGVERFAHMQAFEAELNALALGDPQILAICILGTEVLAGVGLVLGRWTRMAAFVAFSEAFTIVTILIQHDRALEALATIESAVLFGATSIYFMASGSGQFSTDTLLRKRARLKAIRDDEIWQRPPYVETTRDESGVYDEEAEVSYSTPGGAVVMDARRRGLRYQSGS